MITPESEFVDLADRANARGGRMAVRHFTQEGAPPLVFTHATGMCASAYKRFLAPLGAEYDILAADLRGHGQSKLPTDTSKLRNWSVYARDMEALLLAKQQPPKGWRLMGHSMGAVVSLLVAAAGRVRVSRLILIEPVIIPGWARIWARTPAFHLMKRAIPIARKAGQRRSSWESYEAVERSYTRKKFFRKWADGVLADYLEGGLTQSDNGVKLACEPAWEAATFAAQGQNFWHHLIQAKKNQNLQPHLFLAEHGSTTPPSARLRLAKAGLETTIIDGSGHLIPQELPEKLAEIVSPALR